MNTWKIKDKIKNGQIDYCVGDTVFIFRRKKSGYPRGIVDNIEYTIRSIDRDVINVAVHSSDGIGWMQPIRVHRSYMIPKSIWRDMRLSIILED
jgi:hypothetical protein